MNPEVKAQVLAAYGLTEDDSTYRVLEALHTAAAADREAGQARLLGEIDAAVEELTHTLLPQELRAAGVRLAYGTEGLV
ncbi:hypothetical protein [Streptomyces canus]|uniref:hypothetical protein n=1 Tax=Streptomyces canus TaxID=58343 RepID=UPI0032523049